MTLIADPLCNVLCGEDTLILTALEHGGSGAISASAHICPELFGYVQTSATGRFDLAEEIFDHLLPLIHILFSESNPAPIKTALSMQGWIQDELRLPMLPASDVCKKCLRNVLEDLKAPALLGIINEVKVQSE